MATIQKKSFWQQYGGLILILGGIAIGALIGAFAPSVGTTIKPIGDIFLNLLFTIVVPLVFVSIASAVGSMANMKRLGRILGSTVGTFIFTGLIAAACVLTWVNLFSPSAGASIQLTTGEVGEAQSAGELLVSSLTVSDFSDLWDKSNMLPLIIFAIIFGFCVSACGGDESPMGKLLNNLNDIIMKFVGVIMFIAPIGLGAYFANLVATYGPEIVGDYGRSMLVYYPLCLLYAVIFFPLYAFLAGGKLGVRMMIQNIFPPAITAFATQSSAATIPVNKEACEQHRRAQGRQRPGAAHGLHHAHGRLRPQFHREDRLPVRRLRQGLRRRGDLCHGHRCGHSLRLCALRRSRAAAWWARC